MFLFVLQIARIFYFCSTTLQGLQTPGQEYVDVEWSSSDGGAAMWIQRLVSVVGGERANCCFLVLTFLFVRSYQVKFCLLSGTKQ